MSPQEEKPIKYYIWHSVLPSIISAIVGFLLGEVGRMSHYDVLIVVGWLLFILAVILIFHAIFTVIYYKHERKQKEKDRETEHAEIKTKLEQEKKKLIEKQNKFIWTDSHELKNLVTIYKDLINPDSKGILKPLAIELFSETQKKQWDTFIEVYRGMWEKIEHFERRVEKHIKSNILKKEDFLILISEFDEIIDQFIRESTCFYGFNSIMERSESRMEKYNKYCGLFNAFLDKYEIYCRTIGKKYETKIKTFNRLMEIKPT